jgi:hypothetical protein
MGADADNYCDTELSLAGLQARCRSPSTSPFGLMSSRRMRRRSCRELQWLLVLTIHRASTSGSIAARRYCYRKDS